MSRQKLVLVLILSSLAVSAPAENISDSALVSDSGRGFDSKVQLPLADYLQLVEEARQADASRRHEQESAEPQVAEVVEQQTVITIEDGRAEVVATYEIEVRGEPVLPVRIPVTGIPFHAEVSPSAHTSLASSDEGIVLAAGDSGRYLVRIEAVADLVANGGVVTLTMRPVVAPVAVTEIDLPADRAWTCQGAVIAEDRQHGERRRLRLGFVRGREHRFELRRDVEESEAERVLCQTEVLTLVQLRQGGLTRHDIVFYEVARGRLDRFALTLPPGLEVERLATDEGEVPPLVEGRELKVQRDLRLTGTGYLVVTSTPAQTNTLSLAAVQPAVSPRARFLAVATTVAAELTPQPESHWGRMDIGDLPASFREISGALGLAAAWRCRTQETTAEVALSYLPPAETIPGVVRERTTTSLLTTEGTLVHRDRLSLGHGGSALTLRLAPGTALWSSQVNGMAVRVVERQGTTVVPLPFGTEEGTTVEVVTVQEHAVPNGRSQLNIAPPILVDPVLVHRWQLLLPEENRYRYVSGDLRPAPAGTSFGRRPLVASEPVSERPRESTVLPGHASLRGIVTYEDGSLPGVTVSLAGSTGGQRTTITDSNGHYGVPGLAAGYYEVIFALESFQTLKRRLRLFGNQVHTVDAAMYPKEITEEITVTAAYETISASSTGSYTNDGMLEGSHGYHPKTGGSTKKKDAGERLARLSIAQARAELDELRQGLVGGVRPVPVEIPESGKALLLTAALPPQAVNVILDVKAKGKR